ncbi:MAG: hypothetical protein IIV97_00305 [Oscillospiraceae bacterium]|nr:hypothetical protein [Oscillospiraceae bacterium]
MEFRKITVSGTSFEMGKAFGIAAETDIRALLDSVLSADAEEKLSKTLRFIPLYEKYFPDMLEEARGIADALNLPLAKALLLQTRWELKTIPSNECTSFACAGPATSGGKVFAGMNKDVPEKSRDMMVLVHMEPASGPRKLLIGYPGSMAGPGMNEHGVCFFGNSLYGGRPRSYSIPQPIMQRLILEQKCAEDAKNLLLKIHRDGHIGFNGNATICDASGDMYCVEMFGDQIAVAEPDPEKGFLAHANNLITKIPSMLEIETPELSGNTIGRTARLNELFNKNAGELDEEMLKDILRDHEGLPFAICRHNGCRPNRPPSFTAMSCVAVPAEGRIWFCKGNPCENPYFLYKV